jgi:hypothetical protein
MKSFQGGHSKDKTSAWTVIANVVTGQLLRFHGSIMLFPGRSGQLSAQTPHRPVRARLTHTVPQVIDSLRRQSARSLRVVECSAARED